MAVEEDITIAGLKQARSGFSLDGEGNRVHQLVYKGQDFDALKASADALVKGQLIEPGWAVNSWNLEGVPGGGGLLTVNCTPYDQFETEDEEGTVTTEQKALRVVWTLKSVRNDVSILAYCDPAGSPSGASRVRIELWQKETDADLAASDGYHKDENNVAYLETYDKQIVAKIRKGVESVIRFYPVLSCKSTWSSLPKKFQGALGYVDDPAAPEADETEAPDDLASFIGGYEWLCVQDDIDQTGAGQYSRVRSWMGIKKTTQNQHPWDPDLYGQSRWPMPLQGASGGGTGGGTGGGES